MVTLHEPIKKKGAIRRRPGKECEGLAAAERTRPAASAAEPLSRGEGFGVRVTYRGDLSLTSREKRLRQQTL